MSVIERVSLSGSLSLCELELVSIRSPECSSSASKLPETLALVPFATVKVSPSSITPTSFCAVGALFIPVTVITKFAVAVPPWVSVIV